MEENTNQEVTISARKDLNIWFNIWIRPRETMRHILETPTNVAQVILLMLVGRICLCIR